jgi:DSF synthase
MHDLLAVDEIAENTLTSAHNVKSTDINFRIMASKRAGIFSLGGDLATFRDLIRDGDRRGLIEYATTAIDAIWSNIRNTAYDDGVTTVALVQGEAQGGGFEAALSAHVLVAEKGAMFGFPEALFGMFPGMGGFQLLSARTSKECAKRSIGSTERYSAEMLYEMGVVDVLTEKGKGTQTLNEWMASQTRESTAKYRDRFGELDKQAMNESIDRWVDQALELDGRQLRTMGYILAAQKRASEQPKKATVTQLRRTISFPDIFTMPLVGETPDRIPSPLLLSPKQTNRFNEAEFVAFIKSSRPWIHENLTRHGALLLRGFSNQGSTSLGRLCAALRLDRIFDASHSVPTPATLFENVFAEDYYSTEMPQALHNAYADCALFPAVKILSCNDQAIDSGGLVTLANTRSIYQHLDESLVAEFERRGITYRRNFHSAPKIGRLDDNVATKIQAWQNIFKTQDRAEVERKCRQNSLRFCWNRDNSIEVYNSAPACISHPDTADRLWFNHVQLIKSSFDIQRQRKSLLARLFNSAKSQSAFTATFSDGTPIPQYFLDEIATVHADMTLEIQLEAGDFLLLDNSLCAQGRHALNRNQLLLMTTF